MEPNWVINKPRFKVVVIGAAVFLAVVLGTLAFTSGESALDMNRLAAAMEKDEPVAEAELKQLDEYSKNGTFIANCRQREKFFGIQPPPEVMTVFFEDPKTGRMAREVLAFEQPDDYSLDQAARKITVKRGKLCLQESWPADSSKYADFKDKTITYLYLYRHPK